MAAACLHIDQRSRAETVQIHSFSHFWRCRHGKPPNRKECNRLANLAIYFKGLDMRSAPIRNKNCRQVGREDHMPEKETIERAKEDAREGKAPSTQAGEFVREEMEHIREGKHGARSTKQAIAIGLSKARRAGVNLPPPKQGKGTQRTRAQAARDYSKGQKSPGQTPSPK